MQNPMLLNVLPPSMPAFSNNSPSSMPTRKCMHSFTCVTVWKRRAALSKRYYFFSPGEGGLRFDCRLVPIGERRRGMNNGGTRPLLVCLCVCTGRFFKNRKNRRFVVRGGPSFVLPSAILFVTPLLEKRRRGRFTRSRLFIELINGYEIDGIVVDAT